MLTFHTVILYAYTDLCNIRRELALSPMGQWHRLFNILLRSNLRTELRHLVLGFDSTGCKISSFVSFIVVFKQNDRLSLENDVYLQTLFCIV